MNIINRQLEKSQRMQGKKVLCFGKTSTNQFQRRKIMAFEFQENFMIDTFLHRGEAVLRTTCDTTKMARHLAQKNRTQAKSEKKNDKENDLKNWINLRKTTEKHNYQRKISIKNKSH